MSLAEVLEPALALAIEGFPMHVGLAGEVIDASNRSMRERAHRFAPSRRNF